MGLSNSLPDSILQPGVCTSTTRPASPYAGQAVFETDTNDISVYDGTAWVKYTGATGTPIQLNGQTISQDYTFPSGYNGLTAGPVTVASGVTVTVTSGCEWSVV